MTITTYYSDNQTQAQEVQEKKDTRRFKFTYSSNNKEHKAPITNLLLSQQLNTTSKMIT
jgi:hypothetical protein